MYSIHVTCCDIVNKNVHSTSLYTFFKNHHNFCFGNKINILIQCECNNGKNYLHLQSPDPISFNGVKFCASAIPNL